MLLRRIALWFALAGGLIASMVALNTVVSVLARAIISKPIPGDIELTQFGVALAISLCLPWCQLHSANIIVDFFTQKLSPPRQARLDAFGAATCSNRPLFTVLKLPASFAVGVASTVSALSVNCGSAVGPVTATSSAGETVALRDDGVAPDLRFVPRVGREVEAQVVAVRRPRAPVRR